MKKNHVIQIKEEYRFYIKLGWNKKLFKEISQVEPGDIKKDKLGQMYFRLSVLYRGCIAEKLYKNNIIPVKADVEIPNTMVM